jgi:lipopolysaccharide/colanic/teichoic acid biosynthesis glycosyltransferase
MSTIPDTRSQTVFANSGSAKAADGFSWGEMLAPVEFSADMLGSESFTPIRGWYLPVKAAVEWSVSLLLFLLAAPALLFFAVLVKLTSRGPSFYSQTRLGLHGRQFRIYKLRTMTHNCEAASGAVWASKNDPRVTRLGKFLRDTHLDELPQLLNILQGHMGLIGPRPERPELVPGLALEIPHYRQRLRVRPGVTGLAQMLLPADSDLFSVRRKTVHDLHYIRHVGPLMDLRIALCTGCYFAAAAAKAGCKMFVGGYGVAIAKKCNLPTPDLDEL